MLSEYCGGYSYEFRFISYGDQDLNEVIPSVNEEAIVECLIPSQGPVSVDDPYDDGVLTIDSHYWDNFIWKDDLSECDGLEEGSSLFSWTYLKF